jgi:hypothetical protein
MEHVRSSPKDVASSAVSAASRSSFRRMRARGRQHEGGEGRVPRAQSRFGYDFTQIPANTDAGAARIPARLDTRMSDTLWYFSGEPHESPLPTVVTASAGTASEGVFEWQVLEGADKAALGERPGATRVVVTDNNRIDVRSIGASRGADDVTVGVANLHADGRVRGYGEQRLGVRNPVGTRQVGAVNRLAAAAYPVPSGLGGDGGSPEEKAPVPENDQLPSASPRSLRPRGTSHAASASWGYESRVTYEAVDDKGNPINGYEVNEQWTSDVVKDDAACDWRRGPAGGLAVPGTTFDDLIGGEGAGRTPAPQAPKSPLGATKEQHWGQDWYIGSTTPGRGTRVQSDTLQKYLDHGEHLNVTSPSPGTPAPAPGVFPPSPPPPKSTSAVEP